MKRVWNRLTINFGFLNGEFSMGWNAWQSVSDAYNRKPKNKVLNWVMTTVDQSFGPIESGVREAAERQ